MGALIHNQRGAVPIAVIVILAITALIGVGAIGFLLGQVVQGIALTIAFAVLGVLFLLNAGSILRWVKAVKRGANQ
jgi:hypothetical protein